MASFGDLNRVNTNVQALDAQLSLNRINKQLAENQLRMSTGQRINRAEDDSAGFSIATKLRSRIGGLTQALQNVGDAKSVLDITEASYNTIMDNLVEMKGLATQAANDTLGNVERGFIGDQLEALAENINKIADQTVYQDYQMLNGEPTAGGGAGMIGTLAMTFQVGERAADVLTAEISAVNIGMLFDAAGADNEIGGASSGIVINQASATSPGALAIDNSVATTESYRAFLSTIDDAITAMSENVNQIGIYQSSLSVRENTLSEAISANESAQSRIMDTDFAKAQSESIRLQILQQTATAALAQANNGPQSVLSFLG